MPGIRQRRDGDGFAAVKADQRRVNQIAHLHHIGQSVDVSPDMIPDLGARRGGKHGLDVNALRPKFEAKPLRQEQHESLGCPVDRHAELGRQSDHRADVDDRALAGFRQTRCNRAGQPQQRGGVKRHKLRNGVGALLDEAAADAGSGVVDQNPDAGVVAQPRLDGGELGGLRQIRLKDVDRYAGFLTQTGSHSLHPHLVTGDQHKVMAAARETVGINRTNSGRCAGDEDCGFGHGIALFLDRGYIHDTHHD